MGPYSIASKYINQQIIQLWLETDKSAIIVGFFNTSSQNTTDCVAKNKQIINDLNDKNSQVG